MITDQALQQLEDKAAKDATAAAPAPAATEIASAA